MERVDASTARRQFARLYNRVAYGGERIVVENHGKGLVALVPIADVKLGALPAEAPPRLNECLDILRHERPALQADGVAHAGIFGSVGRDAARPDSDVDVLIEFAADTRVDLIVLAGVYDRLVRAFGRDVDVVTRGSLRKGYDDGILAETVSAF